MKGVYQVTRNSAVKAWLDGVVVYAVENYESGEEGTIMSLTAGATYYLEADRSEGIYNCFAEFLEDCYKSMRNGFTFWIDVLGFEGRKQLNEGKEVTIKWS